MSRVDEIKSRTVFPKQPAIRKQGTISCNCIVETTPIVYRGELYRFEVVRRKSFTSATKGSWHDVEDSPCLRFVKVRTNEATPIFAEDHTFGFPIVVGDKMYVVTGKSKTWGADTLVFMRSDDLVSWEIYQELPMPGFKIYNMNIAQKDGKYTLLIEISHFNETDENRIVEIGVDLLHVRLGKTSFRGIKSKNIQKDIDESIPEVLDEIVKNGIDVYCGE